MALPTYAEMREARRQILAVKNPEAQDALFTVLGLVHQVAEQLVLERLPNGEYAWLRSEVAGAVAMGPAIVYEVSDFYGSHGIQNYMNGVTTHPFQFAVDVLPGVDNLFVFASPEPASPQFTTNTLYPRWWMVDPYLCYISADVFNQHPSFPPPIEPVTTVQRSSVWWWM